MSKFWGFGIPSFGIWDELSTVQERLLLSFEFTHIFPHSVGLPRVKSPFQRYSLADVYGPCLSRTVCRDYAQCVWYLRAGLRQRPPSSCKWGTRVTGVFLYLLCASIKQLCCPPGANETPSRKQESQKNVEIALVAKLKIALKHAVKKLPWLAKSLVSHLCVMMGRCTCECSRGSTWQLSKQNTRWEFSTMFVKVSCQPVWASGQNTWLMWLWKCSLA